VLVHNCLGVLALGVAARGLHVAGVKVGRVDLSRGELGRLIWLCRATEPPALGVAPVRAVVLIGLVGVALDLEVLLKPSLCL